VAQWLQDWQASKAKVQFEPVKVPWAGGPTRRALKFNSDGDASSGDESVVSTEKLYLI